MPRTLAKVLERVFLIGPEQALLWSELLIDGPLQYGCMSKDVAESTLNNIELRSKLHSCPLHACIEIIPSITS